MANLQVSVAVQNAILDSIETTIGTAPRLRMYTGTQPANCAAAASGTLLVDMTLPSDWLAAAASNSKAKLGTWEDASADAGGTAGHWRIYESTLTTCHMQGDITATSGGGNIELDNTSISVGQQVTITSFTMSAANS